MDDENRYDQIDSALLGVTLALEGLEDTGMDDAMVSLRDAKDQLERELARLDMQLAAEEAASIAALNREYERNAL